MSTFHINDAAIAELASLKAGGWARAAANLIIAAYKAAGLNGPLDEATIERERANIAATTARIAGTKAAVNAASSAARLMRAAHKLPEVLSYVEDPDVAARIRATGRTYDRHNLVLRYADAAAKGDAAWSAVTKELEYTPRAAAKPLTDDGLRKAVEALFVKAGKRPTADAVDGVIALIMGAKAPTKPQREKAAEKKAETDAAKAEKHAASFVKLIEPADAGSTTGAVKVLKSLGFHVG